MITKVEHSSKGNRTADFKMQLTRIDLKKISALTPEQKRQLHKYLQTCYKVFDTYKMDIIRAMSE
jgi:Spy/CpxP family protein refolding chaperone